MSHSEDHRSRQRELAELQEDFPGFRIWREVTGERVRLVAVRRRFGTSPHAELRAVLAGQRHVPARP